MKIKPIVFVATLLTFCISISSCTAQPEIVVKSNDSRLEYMGRHDSNDSAAILYWSGSSVSINFDGTSVSASIKDEKGQNYYYCIIDGNNPSKMHLDSVLKTYQLASGLPAGKHTAEIFKLTEEKDGKTWFSGFSFPAGSKILPAIAHKRKIEFYGNSITCGYSLEDALGDSGEPRYFNNYYSYAAITARHYDAEYSCIAKSGIGLMLSWFHIIMPEMYDRIDPMDSVRKWDFSRYTPQVVVVNLLQNDSWLTHMPDHPQFKARFGTKAPGETDVINSYKKFIATLRNKYPDATIICVLGSMDATKEGSVWPFYITKAVADMHDPKIFTHFFPYKGTPGHPKKKEQQQMADDLIDFIDKHVSW